jgi:phosphatidylglycerophosphatase A
MPPPSFGFLLSSPGRFLALGFGLGLSPKAPGTVGTLGGYVLALPLIWAPLWVWGPFLLLAFILGCRFCDEAGKALGVPDHGSIVWDEIVAFAAVLLSIPATLEGWLFAFVLFRFFDILKPWPINWADRRFKNGFGVMFDDILAALYALLTFHALALAWMAL